MPSETLKNPVVSLLGFVHQVNSACLLNVSLFKHLVLHVETLARRALQTKRVYEARVSLRLCPARVARAAKRVPTASSATEADVSYRKILAVQAVGHAMTAWSASKVCVRRPVSPLEAAKDATHHAIRASTALQTFALLTLSRRRAPEPTARLASCVSRLFVSTSRTTLCTVVAEARLAPQTTSAGREPAPLRQPRLAARHSVKARLRSVLTMSAWLCPRISTIVVLQETDAARARRVYPDSARTPTRLSRVATMFVPTASCASRTPASIFQTAI